MPAVTPWDVRIVNAATLAAVAYVPHWESLQFGDSLNSPGHGAVTVDYDEPWLAAFNTANSAYPWEGNYAIQVLRSGTLVFTFIIEEAEVEYAGLNRRRAVMGGRGIAAALEWAIVLPGGFDETHLNGESVLDPDELIVTGGMNRGFGNTHDTQDELDDDTYSVDNPKYKAFGGAAFVYLFNEADTGNVQTADTASSYAIATANRSAAVDWPLSLATNMSETKDANDVLWSATATYPNLDVTWKFEIAAGMNMYEALTHCAEITANAQWRVAPDGKVSIADAIGDATKVDTILLTVPNATMSTNQLHRKDLRTAMFGSNGYSFEKATSDAAVTNIYGRREMFMSADQAHGESVLEAAKQALNDVDTTLDEFTFGYIETDSTQAWLDFTVGDTVRIEYEAGRSSNRQVTGLSASITDSSEKVEVTIGDVVENAFARLAAEEETGQPSWQIDYGNKGSSGVPVPPRSVAAVTSVDGLDRSVEVTFKQSGGWENEIALYEAEVWKV
jgi:hypothetical protein